MTMAQSIEATGGSRSRRLMLVLSVVVLALVGFANKAAAFDYDPGDSSRNEGVTTLDIPPLHASEPSDMLRAGLPPWHRTKLRVYHLEPHAQARGIAMSRYSEPSRSAGATGYTAVPAPRNSFLLELDAYNRTVCLHLFPNDLLVAPSATETLVNGDASAAGGSSVDGAQPANVTKLDDSRAKPHRGYVISLLDHRNPDSAAAYECGWNITAPRYEDYEADSMIGWARLIVKPQLFRASTLRKRDIFEIPLSPEYEGVFTIGIEIFTVKSVETYVATKREHDAGVPDANDRDEAFVQSRMIIFRNDDVRADASGGSSASAGSETPFCGRDIIRLKRDSESGKILQNTLAEVAQLAKRGISSTFVNGTKSSVDNVLVKRAASGCPTTTKVLYMGVAADCEYIAAYGSTAAARDQILSNWNIISAVYEKMFNIVIGIIDIRMFPICNTPSFNKPCSTPGYAIDDRLFDFSEWRGTQNADAGLWHLMSDCPTGSTIGIAWMGTVCYADAFLYQQLYWVSSTGVTTINPYEWITVAHEIGHNMGANHDCVTSMCTNCGGSCVNDPDEICADYSANQCSAFSQFIMNPWVISSVINPPFSPASQRDMCDTIDVYGGCLAEPGLREIENLGGCGNGLLEEGEECDCGGAVLCEMSPCCNADCTLVTNAQCSDDDHDCCRNCFAIPSSEQYQCRTKSSECDEDTVCSGGITCPKNFAEDLTTCGNSGGLACASGMCTSRDQQCVDKMGVPGSVSCTKSTSDCKMACTDASNACIQLSALFLDGTPCGASGSTCIKNVCTVPDGLTALRRWLIANKYTVGIVGSVLLVGIAFGVHYARKRARMAMPPVVAIEKNMPKSMVYSTPQPSATATMIYADSPTSANAMASPMSVMASPMTISVTASPTTTTAPSPALTPDAR